MGKRKHREDGSQAHDSAGAQTSDDLEDLQEALAEGKAEIVPPPAVTMEDTFTAGNIAKFCGGEITWAELTGMTMDEAYGIAQHGYELYQEGKYHEARTIFEALVLANPYDAYFHTMTGAVYQQLDMLEQALTEYNTAIDLDDQDLQAYVNRAEILLQQHTYERALDDLRRVIDLDSQNEQQAGQRARALVNALANALDSLPKVAEKLSRAKEEK